MWNTKLNPYGFWSEYWSDTDSDSESEEEGEEEQPDDENDNTPEFIRTVVDLKDPRYKQLVDLVNADLAEKQIFYEGKLLQIKTQ